jgi:hypothetical protein
MTARLRWPAGTGAILLGLLAWLLPTLAPAHAAGAQRPSSDLLIGVNIGSPIGGSPTQADRDLPQLHALGAKIMRVEVPWSALEPRQPGQIDPGALASTDRLMNEAASVGIRVIVLVQGTPCWASSAPAAVLRRCNPSRGGQANAWPPRQPAAFAAFVAYLAGRYGHELAAIEIWNEPDQANERYFAGPDKAARYAAILRAAYPAIKQADPETQVLAGAIVGSSGAFLRALYAAGIKGYYDGLAVHYYTLTLGSLRAIHEVQLANGDDTPLWLDEFGWTSCWPHAKLQEEQPCVTPQVQAANITSVFRTLQRTPYVAAAVLYKLRDSSNEDFGLLSASGRRKPSFAALARVIADPPARETRPSLRLHVRSRHVIASGSGPVGDFMELEALQGNVPRYRAFFILNRFNDYSIGLPAQLGTSGLTVRVFQYWQGPGAAAQRSI